MKIVYKIIAVIMALVIIPALMFLPTVAYRFNSVAAQLVLTLTQNSEKTKELLEKFNGEIPDTIADSESIYNISRLVEAAKNATDTSSDVTAQLETPIITLLIIAALIAICALLTAIFAIVSKDNCKVYYSSLAGIGASIMFKFAFESVAAPFVSGQISLSDFIDSIFATFIAKVEMIDLSVSFYAIPLLFLGVIAWTFLYNYTLPEKEKLARKNLIGEKE